MKAVRGFLSVPLLIAAYGVASVGLALLVACGALMVLTGKVRG